jgi:hypothetical protein
MLPKFTDGNQGMQTWKKDGDPFVFGKPPASYERYYVLGYPVNPSIDNPFMNVSWSYSGKGNYDAATNGKPKFEHSSDQGTCSWEANERKECGGCGLEDYTRGPLRCGWERIWHQTVERVRRMIFSTSKQPTLTAHRRGTWTASSNASYSSCPEGG